MIKFISHNQISGKIQLDTPMDMISIEQSVDNSPVVYQLRFEQGKHRLLRSVSHIKGTTYMSTAELPKDFIASDLKIKARILIIGPDGEVTETNPIPVEINKEKLAMTNFKEDTIKRMSERLNEVERLVKIMSLHQTPVELDIPNLGKPQAGMVITAFTENLFGWSHLFTEVIKEINGLKTIDGTISLAPKDILFKDSDLEDYLLKQELQYNKIKDAIKKLSDLVGAEIKAVATLQKTLNEYVNRDVL